MTAAAVPDDQDARPEGLLTIQPSTPASSDLGERIPFTLPGDDDTILWAIRPKNMLLMLIAGRVQGAKDADDEDKVAATIQCYRTFTDAALDPASADIIWDRLGDPTDTLDDDAMDALIETLMGRWLGPRPTQQRSGRAALPRTTGRVSTGRKRSAGSTQKT